MGRLTVTYEGFTPFDGEVERFSFTVENGAVKVEGGPSRSAAAGPNVLSGLGDQLAAAMKRRTEAHGEQLKAAPRANNGKPPEPVWAVATPEPNDG